MTFLNMERTLDNIDAVPAEIWDKIFLHAIPSPIRTLADQDGASRASRSDILFSITHTCARWRDIAISRPSLWHTFTIYIHGDKQSPNQHLLDLMIERSANTPLSINLFMIDLDDIYPISGVYQSLMSLFVSMTRWKNLGLYLCGCSIPLFLIEQLSRTGLPSLESLRLDVRLENRESDALLDTLWQKSPRLCRVLLSSSNNAATYFEQVPSTIPYSKITSLFIHNTMAPIMSIGASMALYVLHDAPNLVSCVITNIDAILDPLELADFPKSQRYKLPLLEYLHLGGRHLSDGTAQISLTIVLDYITAPSLKTLGFSNATRWVQDDFERFMIRSGCLLDEIHFFNPRLVAGDLGPSTLIPILRGIPSINGIHFGGLKDLLGSDESTFAAEMMEWNTGRGEFELCPNLSWLSFHDPTAFDIEPRCDLDLSGAEMLVRILKARLDPPEGGERRFEKIYIPSYNLSKEAYHGVQALRDGPYTLDIRSDDQEILSNIHDLWEKYGNR